MGWLTWKFSNPRLLESSELGEGIHTSLLSATVILIGKNYQVKTSEILSFIKAMRTLAKAGRINFFRTLKITKNWSNLGNVYSPNNGWILVRTASFVVSNLPYFHSTPSSFCENQQPAVIVNVNSHWGGRTGLDLLKSPTPRELSLFDMSAGSLEDSTTTKVAFMWPDSELIQSKQPSFWSKTVRGNCQTLQLPEIMDNIWGKQ